MKYKSHLSIYSCAFLFRMKLSTNLSFRKLRTLFCTSKKYVRRIYRNILKITYTNHLALPNVLLNDDEVEKFFEYAAAGLDTFYSELLKPFKDPLGKYINPFSLPLSSILF